LIRIDGGRHHDEAQIVAGTPRLPGQRDSQVRVNAPFVEFVKNDGPERREQRVLLKASRQDSFGGYEEPCVSGKATLQANLPADLTSDVPPAFDGNAIRDGASGRPARLQQEDCAIGGQRWWNPCGFSRSRIGHHDDRPSTVQRRKDLGQVGVDREWCEHD
jgi:hypothetical protein